MINIFEKTDSRAHDQGRRYSIKLMVSGTADSSEAESAAEYFIQERGIDTKYDLDSVRTDPVNVDELHPENSFWTVSLDYVPAELQNNDKINADNPYENKVSFSTCGGSEHITHSLSTVLAVPATAVDYDHAIGVTDKSIQGLNKRSGTLKMSVTIKVPYGYTMKSYQYYLDARQYQINNKSFLGRPAKCVQFVGGEGVSPGVGKDFEFTLNFEIRREEKDIDCGNNIVVPYKAGWDYLWTLRQKQPLTISGKKYIREVPIAAYVEQIYYASNLNDLLTKKESDAS